MSDVCQKAETFLTEVIEDLGFQLDVSSRWIDDGCLLNLSGADVDMALSENAEMLDAFEVLLFQAMGRELDREHRLFAMRTVFGKRAKPSFRQWPVLQVNRSERAVGHLHLACLIPLSGG